MTLKVYVSNDNVIQLSGLQNKINSSYINNATVNVILVEAISGTQVVGETWPLTLDYVSASDAIYRATIADTLDFSVYSYIARLSADAGTGLKGYWEIPVIAVTRID